MIKEPLVIRVDRFNDSAVPATSMPFWLVRRCQHDLHIHLRVWGFVYGEFNMKHEFDAGASAVLRLFASTKLV